MGKLERWKENSVVGRDATMVENETGEIVIDNRHLYGLRGRHGFVASESD